MGLHARGVRVVPMGQVFVRCGRADGGWDNANARRSSERERERPSLTLDLALQSNIASTATAASCTEERAHARARVRVRVCCCVFFKGFGLNFICVTYPSGPTAVHDPNGLKQCREVASPFAQP